MTSKEHLEPYETDASGIGGSTYSVIFPKSAEEISKLISLGSNFTIRGGGTGLAGGAVPQNSVVLDLSKMNKILNFDKAKRLVEVEAGLILDELNAFLDKFSLEFPVQPSSHSICTIGGMIAANSVGNRAIKYGKTSDFVEQLKVVNGKGEILNLNKTELSDFLGMEGITGIIISAKLRVIDKKYRTCTVLKFNSLEQVDESIKKYKLDNQVSMLEFLDKFTSSLIELEDKYHLIVEFENNEGELKDEKYQAVLELRDSIYPALCKAGFTRIEDPKIFINKLQELGEFLESCKIPYYGHVGVGIIHPVFPANSNELIRKMFSIVRRMHGQVSGEHGIGLIKKEFLDVTEKKLISAVKKRQDPHCKLNCGKVIDFEKNKEEKKIEEKEKEE